MKLLLTSLVIPFFLIRCASFGAPSFAYPNEGEPPSFGTIKPIECGIEREIPMESLIGNYYLENGLEVFMFDTNGDGNRDVQILIPQDDQNRYPLFYMFDRDYDGDPDMHYTDKRRDGTCDGIEAEFIGDGVNSKEHEL